ncbi:hypothetical protein OPT61_g6986 [Boeremia exigua]|uniref:Uncharacterized protein n=1 Tax=Boeremia exigua TaxID=749465 RepID=A0ACC2I536_9PLEO|nr:hypothetical protein OPT61_g6986 [Boeremia exigua]
MTQALLLSRTALYRCRGDGVEVRPIDSSDVHPGLRSHVQRLRIAYAVTLWTPARGCRWSHALMDFRSPNESLEHTERTQVDVLEKEGYSPVDVLYYRQATRQRPAMGHSGGCLPTDTGIHRYGRCGGNVLAGTAPTSRLNTSNSVRTLWRALSNIDSESRHTSEIPDAAAYNSFLCWLRYVILVDIAQPRLSIQIPPRRGRFKPRPCDSKNEIGQVPEAVQRSRLAIAGYACVRGQFRSGHNLLLQHLGAERPRSSPVRDARQRIVEVKGCFTQASRKLGSGPRAMEGGDVIMYVPDTITPYVFRRKEEGKYWLIGEAHIHGVPQHPEQYEGKLKAFSDSEGADFGEDIRIL